MLTPASLRGLSRPGAVLAIAAICLLRPPIGVDPALCDQSSSLRLEISAEKSRYLVGEPIWIDMVLKNVSQDTVVIGHRVVRPEYGNLKFLIVGDGDTLQYADGFAMFISRSMNLPPGGELRDQFDVLEYYGKCGEGTMGFEMFFDPGVYSIRARAFRSVTSNTLEVEVVEPSGQEAEIYRVFHEAAVLRAQKRYDEAAEKLHALLPSAEQSPYRDKLYYMLIRILSDDKARRGRLAERVLRDYPNSRYARPCALRAFSNMTRAEAEKFVTSLESAAPGTRAAVEARRLLRTYEFRK